MSTQKMTHKIFIKKASGSISAAGFLDLYNEFLMTGTLKEKCEPILIELNLKKLMPTQALSLIRQQVYDDMQEITIREFEAKETARQEKQALKLQISESKPKKEKEVKNHQVFIYSSDAVSATRKVDEKIINLSMTFDKYQEAERWASRRLTEGAEGWYAEIVSNKLLNRDGVPIKTKIERRVAFSNLRPTNKGGPMMKKMGKKNGSLTSRMKASGSRCNFSRG